jgi:hypothetical protein
MLNRGYSKPCAEPVGGKVKSAAFRQFESTTRGLRRQAQEADGRSTSAGLPKVYNPAMPNNSNPASHQRKVGDKIRVSMQMHGGEIVDATIKAVIETTSDTQYQIDFGNDQTATVTERQIVKE